MSEKEVCLLNDSFPPLIDGVSNTVVNYAENVGKFGYKPIVVTPSNPDADDSRFKFDVVRYPSLDLRKQIGYTAGNPFFPKTLQELGKRDIKVIHSHCPAASNYLARGVRELVDAPLIMTYHTKYDVDIINAVRGKLFQQEIIKGLVETVSAVDELWVVSEGAGENVRSLGYTGDYVVMRNGVDLPRQRATQEEIIEATKGYDLPENVPVYLFVGRMMWYKGLRIIIDALAALRSQNIDFRMIFIGGGGDENEVKKYVSDLKLDNKIFFTGAIHDRKILTAWYSRSDLFLFPSTYDTNGLVVREAAACSVGTVLIGGSCAAEGITDRRNGLIIEDNAASLAVCLAKTAENRDFMRDIGVHAADEIYLSWEDSVKIATERYEVVIENYKSGKKHKQTLADGLFQLQSDFISALDKLDELKKKIDDKNGRYL